MIARFSDLQEKLILNRNTSLKDFVYSTFKRDTLGKVSLKNIVDKEGDYSSDLTDGKPGDWLVLERKGDLYLWVSCSEDVNGDEFVNDIIVYRFTENGNFLARHATYGFFDAVSKGGKAARNAAKFVRKLMRSSVLLNGNNQEAHRMMQRESDISHSWE